MTRYEPAGELASRDLVSRAIVREQHRTGAPVYLSMANLDPEWTRARFPTIAEACRSLGLDLGTDRIPVGPAAHYVMGGVETDLWGRTTCAASTPRAKSRAPACTAPIARQQFAARRPGFRRARRAGDAAAWRRCRCRSHLDTSVESVPGTFARIELSARHRSR
jgi:succinate dehydrogenase/fumarate reductase flavoprotein subunit